VNWLDIAPQILLAIIAASPGVYAIWRGRHKEKAEVAKAITEAAGELVEDYQNTIKELRAELKELRKIVDSQEEELKQNKYELQKQDEELKMADRRITDLELERDESRRGISQLCRQLRSLGHAPVWEPKP